MQITVIAVSRMRRGYYLSGCQDYFKRLCHYTRAELIEVRALRGTKQRTPEAIKEAEGQRLLERVPRGTEIIALDEGGAPWSTEVLAAHLEERQLRGHPGCAFLIGGPLGLSDEVRDRAHRRLSLSAFTLPHDLARLVLLEQLYRAFTVIQGEPYHNP